MEQRTTTRAEWDTGVGTGLLRLAAGVFLLRRRGTLARWAAGGGDDPVVRALFAYFGVRDLTLGVLALAATRPGGDVARQVTLQGVADTTDAGLVAAAIATGRLPRRTGVPAIVLAVVSAATEYAGAWRLRRRADAA